MALLPQNHQRGIDRNAGHPRREGRPSVKFRNVEECAKKRILQGIFRILAILGYPVQGPQNSGLEALAEYIECHTMPALRGSDQDPIVQSLIVLPERKILVRQILFCIYDHALTSHISPSRLPNSDVLERSTPGCMANSARVRCPVSRNH